MTGITGQRWPHVSSLEVTVSPGSGERAAIVTPAAGGAGPGEAGDPAPTTAPARAAAMLRWPTRSWPRPWRRPTALRGRGYLHQPRPGGPGGSARPRSGRSTRAPRTHCGGGAWTRCAPAPGDVALDLYCGAGLFAGVLAEAVGPGGAVIGVESDRGAVRDARHNLRRLPWARIHHGDVAAVLGPGAGAAGGAGLAVLDPPRAGAWPAPSSSGWPRAGRTRRPRCGGWRTSPVTRPPWPATSRSSVSSAGGWPACGPSTRSR